jgi:hypothetical protein
MGVSSLHSHCIYKKRTFIMTKPSKKMHAAGWKALHSVASDPDAGDTARVSAARALVRDDPEQKAAEDEAAKASRGRPGVLCLPHNFRDEAVFGITRTDHCIRVSYVIQPSRYCRRRQRHGRS